MPAQAVTRDEVVSYDTMRGGAPHHGYFDVAWQPFVAQSSVVTHIGVTVGTHSLPAGATGYGVRVRVCAAQPDSAGNCGGLLAERSVPINNYGNSYADFGDIPTSRGTTYWVVWFQPPRANGASWVTYWWGGGSSITTSDQMQLLVRGYEPALTGAGGGPPTSSQPVGPLGPASSSGGGTAPQPSQQATSAPTMSSYRYAVANVDRVNLRAGPGRQYPTRGSLPGNTPIEIVCQTLGESINGSPVWDKLVGDIYISDWFTTTPNVGTYSPPIPRCSDAPSEAHPTPEVGGRWKLVAGGPVHTRRGPGSGHPPAGDLRPGAQFNIECQTTGESVFGSTIWDKLTDGRFLSDYFTDTPVYAGFSPEIPRCPGTNAASANPTEDKHPALEGFSRAGVVAYADANWNILKDDYPNDCTNYVSWAWHVGGGLPTTDWWAPTPLIGAIPDKTLRPALQPAWSASDRFADAMAGNGWITRTDIRDLSAKTVPGAQPGDVILWHDHADHDGSWTHTALVMGTTARGLTLISQHSDERNRVRWNDAWHKRRDLRPYLRAQLLHVRA